jgi:hypothetical protein
VHDEIETFIATYSAAAEPRIAFAWNGKHSESFVDSNYDFRKAVLVHVLANKETAPVPLIRDLFLAETRYSKEAWAVDPRVGELAKLLLTRGGPDYVEAFLEGKYQGMDASMAATSFAATEELLSSLVAETEHRLRATELSASRRRLLEFGRDDFARWLKVVRKKAV